MVNKNYEELMKRSLEEIRRLKAQVRDKDNRIAVIGLACHLPGGINSPEEYYDKLMQGFDMIQKVPDGRWSNYDKKLVENNPYLAKAGFLQEDINGIDNKIFRLSPREAERMDPQQKLLLKTCYELMENSGYAPDALNGSNTGIYIGTSSQEFFNYLNSTRDINECSGFDVTGVGFSFFSGRIAHLFGLRGPAITEDTACSSSLLCVNNACQALLTGECDMAIAGGVNIMLTPQMTMLLSELNILSEDCTLRCFDEEANGTVRGEGCGLIMLKRLSDAEKCGDKIYAVINGGHVNQDGASSSLTAPYGPAQNELIKKAWEKSGLDINKADFIETHGTGTNIGDNIELAELFKLTKNKKRKKKLYLGSVKSNIGHLEAASGIASLIKTIKILQNRSIPKNINITKPSRYINNVSSNLCSPTENIKLNDEEIITAGVSSFGLSGTNVHIVLSEYKEGTKEYHENNNRKYMKFSSNSDENLHLQLSKFGDFLNKNKNIVIDDLTYSMNISKADYDSRLVISFDNFEELYNNICYAIEGKLNQDIQKNDAKKHIVFMFTGQGSQSPKMMYGLYKNNSIFNRHFNQCNDYYKKLRGIDLVDIIMANDNLVNRTEYTQPCLFAVEYSLAQTYIEYGIIPELVLGHSIGEYVAAVISGVFSLREAIELVVTRGELMQNNTKDGAMLAVFEEYSVIDKYYKDAEGIYIAATNSQNQTVFSGTQYNIDNFYELLKQYGIKAVKLNVQKAFHSPIMQGMLDEYYKVCNGVKYRLPRINVISNVTGKVESSKLMNAEYWCNHITSEVKFLDSILNIQDIENYMFIEIGPRDVLASLVRTITDNNVYCIEAYSKIKDEINMEAIIQAYLVGQKINWRAYYNSIGKNYNKISIPNYSFEENNNKLISNPISNVIFTTKPQYENKDIRSLILDFLHSELMISVENVSDNDNLLTYGVSSIVMTKFTAMIKRIYNANIKTSELIKNCTIASWKELIEKAVNSDKSEVKKNICINKSDSYGEFELNEIQYAYWTGRNKGVKWGGVACYALFEIDVNELDIEMFIEALNKLVIRHDMLRCNISDRAVQKIQENIELPIKIYNQKDIEDEDKHLENLKEEMSHMIIPLGEPMFNVRISELKDNKYKIYFGIDFMIFDALSIYIFVKDLYSLYRGEELEPLELTYKDYLEYTRNNIDEKKYEEDKLYWVDRMDTLPVAPYIPTRNTQDNMYNVKFYRMKKVLSLDDWRSFEANATKNGITPSVALLTLYCEVLSAFGGGKAFGIMLTVFNREDIHRQVNDIIGDFTKLLLLEVNRSDSSFKVNANRIQEQMYSDIEHSSFSGLEVVQELRRTRGRDCMYPFVFTSALGMDWISQSEEDNLFIKNMNSILSSTPQVWLDHQIFNENGGIALSWDIAEGVFEEGIIEGMFEVYIRLVEEAIHNEEFWDEVGKDLRPNKQLELHNIVNKTERSIQEKLLYEDYLIQVKERSDNIAIICEGISYTYKELDERANDYYYELDKNKIDKTISICINVKKSFEQIACIIGTLKHGNAYIPLSYNQPEDRTRIIMEEAQSTVIITDNDLDLDDKYLQLNVKRINKNNISDEVKTYGKCDDIAYIIFTSGSTGKPKGVCISHKAAMNTIQDVNRRYSIIEEDRCFAISAISFDLSVYDIFGLLSVGGAIVIPTEEQRNDPIEWTRLVQEYKVTVWNSVPQIMEILTDYLVSTNKKISSIRKIILSGDWISLTLPNKIKRVMNNAELTSMGGATEASIWSNYYEVKSIKPSWRSIPYGYPLSNQRFYILDEFNRMCPNYVKGQLYIAGAGLAEGYLNDVEKTNTAFVIKNDTRERIYNTGDYGRYLSDGSIEFLGRQDNQLKINGYRVESAEIIEGFNKSGIQSEIIILSIGDRSSDKHLCAVIKQEEGRIYDQCDIKEKLKDYIPRYFIPDIIIFVEEFPITINSKIDKKKLKELCKNYYVDKKVEIKEEVDNPILEVIRKTLGINGISPNDNLNELGVSSVDIIKLANQLEIEFGNRPSVAQIISYESIGELVDFYSSVNTYNYTEIQEEDNEKGIIGLKYEDYIHAKNIIDSCSDLGIELYLEDSKLKYRSKASRMTKDIQELLKSNKELIIEYFIETDKEKSVQLTPIQLAYVMGRSEDYELGNIDAHYYTELEWNNFKLERFEKALNNVIEENEILRTLIYKNGNQQVLKEVPYYIVEYDVLNNNDDFIKKRELLEKNKFEFGKWPMFDIRVSKINDKEIIHFSFDCTILDGISSQMLLNIIYKKYMNKTVDKPRYTLRQYVQIEKEWLTKREDYKLAEEYWLNKLEFLPKAPQLNYRTSFNAIKEPRFNRLKVEIDEDKTKKLYQRNKEYGLTISAVICSMYMKTLSNYSFNKEFTINLTMFNRQPLHRDVDNILGDFTNVTFIDYNNKSSFIEIVQDISDKLWKAIQHRSYSGLDILKKLSNNAYGKAIMPIVFTSMLEGDYKKDVSEIFSEVKEIYSISRTPQVALDHQAFVRDGKLVLIWDYVEQLFERKVIEAMFDKFIDNINILIDNDNWEEI